jgi:cell division protein FtsL
MKLGLKKNKSEILQNKSNIKKPLLLITFFIAVIITLSVIQVAISNRISTAGIELENLQSQIEKYKKQNTLLEEKILEASALTNISKKAKALGFVDYKSQVYLTNPLPIALSNQSATP